MIVERVGRRIAIEARPEDVKSWTHVIAGETMRAIDCDAMEMMRISSRWDVGEQLA